jgi:hypothetical protein
MLAHQNLIPEDLITVSEAREILKISRATMTKIISRGDLRTFRKPVDRRTKFVSRAAVLELLKPRPIEDIGSEAETEANRRYWK